MLRVTLVNPASDGITIILNERDSITDIVELITPSMVGIEQTYEFEFTDAVGNWVLAAVTPLGIEPPTQSNFFNDSVSLQLTIQRRPCDIADANGDGTTSPADFNAWVIAFNNGAPECDQNGDGLCNPADFNAWILNFNAC
ncbi:MAG: GC-type dockerin domain-anchored protein [Planctomycetota bacterium]